MIVGGYFNVSIMFPMTYPIVIVLIMGLLI